MAQKSKWWRSVTVERQWRQIHAIKQGRMRSAHRSAYQYAPRNTQGTEVEVRPLKMPAKTLKALKGETATQREPGHCQGPACCVYAILKSGSLYWLTENDRSEGTKAARGQH